MTSPEERLRLLDPAHDPPREFGMWTVWDGLRKAALDWRDRADARLAILQEAVKVLADLGLGVSVFMDQEISLELAHLLAAEHRHADGAVAEDATTEDYLEVMVSDGLMVRGGGDG